MSQIEPALAYRDDHPRLDEPPPVHARVIEPYTQPRCDIGESGALVGSVEWIGSLVGVVALTVTHVTDYKWEHLPHCSWTA